MDSEHIASVVTIIVFVLIFVAIFLPSTLEEKREKTCQILDEKYGGAWGYNEDTDTYEDYMTDRVMSAKAAECERL